MNRLPDFSNTRILVAGDAMIDRYLSGEALRTSPEAPVPVVLMNPEKTEDRPGGAANVAANLAALQVQTSLLAITGTDEHHQTLADLVQQQGVAAEFIQMAGACTIIKQRLVSGNQQLVRMDYELPIDKDAASALAQRTVARASQADALVLSDYGKGSLAQVQNIISGLRECDIPILIDPKGSNFERYRGATLLTPNSNEFTGIVGPCRHNDDFAAQGIAMRHEFDLQALLITRGEQGMTLIDEHDQVRHLATAARQTFDVTGAGDTVIAMLGACMGQDIPLSDAIWLANHAAGIAISKARTSTVSPSDMHPDMQLPANEITLAEIAQAQAQGARIVFTNGCFDLLHAGHVRYLNEAAELGDKLVVGINSDTSVSRLKGALRPIVNEQNRAESLLGLRAVNWVLIFEENDSPLELIKAIQPQVLVKGGDYSIDEIIGADLVTSTGGEVRALSKVEGLSSSSIIARIKDAPG